MPLPRWLARSNKLLANRLLIRFSDRPPFAALRHVGRNSRTEYRIPINVFRAADGFVVALTYGSGADWVRNVVAAGGATLEYDGADLRVVDPRVVGPEQVAAVIPTWVQMMLRAVGVSEFLRLEVAPGYTTERPAELQSDG